MCIAAPPSPAPLIFNDRILADADTNQQNWPPICAIPSYGSPSLHRIAFADHSQSQCNVHYSGQRPLGKIVSPAQSFSRVFGPGARRLSSENGENACASYNSTEGNIKSVSRVSFEKRRPAKLNIPESSKLASLTKATQFIKITEQAADAHNVNVHLHGTEHYAVASKKGRKDQMEDFHIASLQFAGDAKQALFGVFDGHGGQHAAKFAAANLGRHVAAVLSNKDLSPSLEDAMCIAYRTADMEFLNKRESSGTCAVSVLVKDGQMVAANAGDCKAVLCRNGKAESLSTIHRACNQEERQRIEDLGGIVDCYSGVWRVQGTLAVTRSLGDADLKRWIPAEPATRNIQITQDCEFLILASDGLWDQMTDQEAVDYARKVFSHSNDNIHGDIVVPTLNTDGATNHIPGILSPIQADDHPLKSSTRKLNACNELIRIACLRGNRDDITVMIVPLDAFALS